MLGQARELTPRTFATLREILQLMCVFYGEKGYLAGKSGDDLADIKAGLAGYSPVLVSA